jgi:hypothetical protein
MLRSRAQLSNSDTTSFVKHTGDILVERTLRNTLLHVHHYASLQSCTQSLHEGTMCNKNGGMRLKGSMSAKYGPRLTSTTHFEHYPSLIPKGTAVHHGAPVRVHLLLA